MALEFRRRVKEQLRKMGSVEFRKTNFSFIIKSDGSEIFVETPEMKLASQYSPLDGENVPDIGFTLGLNHLGRYSLYRIEVGLRKGRGSWNATGLAGKPIKEALITVREAWNLSHNGEKAKEVEETENRGVKPKKKVSKKENKIELIKKDKTEKLEESSTIDNSYPYSFILDGSNIARNNQNSRNANIQDVMRCRNNLASLGVPKSNIFIIFGAGLRHHLRDVDKGVYGKLIQEKNMNQAPKGRDDDWFIIEFAVRNKSYMITNDYYTDYKIKHPKYKKFIESHSVRYNCLGNQFTFEEGFKERFAEKKVKK